MTDDVTIREATPQDAEQLIAHVHRVAAEPDIDLVLMPGEFKVTVEEERKFLADHAAADNSSVFVAEAAGRLVGVVVCTGGTRRALRHAATLGITVAKDWRGRGVGSRLVARAVEWARGTGVVTRIELTVFVRNEAARRVYEKLGFVVEGRRRNAVCRDGVYFDDFVMALTGKGPEPPLGAATHRSRSIRRTSG